jgi:class 3 adenylate cyclase
MVGTNFKGSIYGGVIGTDIVRFDIYGPEVLIANKMESGGTPGQICVSQRTKELLELLETTNYTFENNKKIEIRSLGIEVSSYFVMSNLLKEEVNDNSLEVTLQA